MPKYTTGEIAKLCGVSVRTVQYYDTRNILVPSELSEGGRRLYSDDDLKRMKLICFLRDVGISINSISELLSNPDPEKVISVLLEEHESSLKEELSEIQKKIDTIGIVKRELKSVENFSVDSISDIAHVLKNKDKLQTVYLTVLFVGLPISIFQWVAVVLWITHGLWWLFLIWLCFALIFGTFVSVYYFNNVAYICPNCHGIFKPRFREAFFANHTPTLRNLTCKHCGVKGLCIETYGKEDKKNG
jgi:DNA-binding transcriptional MerR regulator